MTNETAGEALRLFESEPIRFRRTVEDYAVLVGTDCFFHAATYLLRRGGDAVAVFSVRREKIDDAPALGVVELAGSRRAVLAALPDVLESRGLAVARIDAYPCDRQLLDACRQIDIAPQPAGTRGTVKLVDAERLWSDFAPLLTERIGRDALARIRLSCKADEFGIRTLTFAMDEEDLNLHGGPEINAALFGSQELDPLGDAPGKLAAVLRRALPLPLPMYGLNYL